MLKTEKIKTHMNENGQIIRWPSKYSLKLIVLDYLSEKFESDKTYTQKEVDEIITRWHTFENICLLRRELIMKGHLNRKRDCSAYWKTERINLTNE
jgi:hypothetical protein